MRSLNFILVLLAVLWATGCQEKLPVELATEQSSTALEVKVVPAIDPNLIVDASVDTSGVTQSEERAYPATFLVNGVKTDLGMSKSTFSYSRMLLNDTKAAITSNDGKVIGYLGMDVGKARVNSVDLPKTYRPLRTYMSFTPELNGGPSYTLVDQDDQPISDFTYTGGQNYRFRADGRGKVASFELAVQSPEEITVVEPRAGSVVFRDEDLKVRWSGAGGSTFRILISSFDPSSNIPVKPLLQVAVKAGTNSVVLPASILKGIQSGSGRFLFSVISSNRITTKIAGYPQDVLVQASSIHNVLLWLK